MSDITGIWENIFAYSGGSAFLIFFFGIVLICFFRAKGKDKKYLGVMILMLLVVLNPLFYSIVSKMGGKSVFYRFLWMLPVPFVLAAGMFWVLDHIDGKYKKAAGICFAVLVIFFGKVYLTGERLKLPENLYGIPDSTIMVSEIIQEDKKEPYVIVAADYATYLTLRQYDADVIYGINRETYLKGYIDKSQWSSLEEPLRKEQILTHPMNLGGYMDEAAVKKCLDDLEIDYLTVVSEAVDDEYMKSIGCRRVGDAGDCVVYCYD